MLQTSLFKSALLGTAITLASFNLTAHAALTSYTANGKEVVFSSESGVTWTKDANLLGSLFANQGFSTVVNAIITANAGITHGTSAYTLTANDFANNGSASWFGAVSFVHYLNSINYAGSNQWRLPTFTRTVSGFNTPSNGTTAGNELPELFYQELNGTAGSPMPNRAIFDNEQFAGYWSATERDSNNNIAWGFETFNGNQGLAWKSVRYYTWAITPGQIAAVPEPDSVAMLLAGSGLLGVMGLRRRKQAD